MNMPDLMMEYAKSIPEKEIQYISPSKLGGCMRKHYYHLKQIPITTPIEPRQKLNMLTGEMWEQIVHDSLKHAKVPFMYHHKMHDVELNMEGTLDFALLMDGGKEMEIWDSKTESSSAKNYRQGGYIESHEEYTHQLNAYAIMAIRSGFTVRRGGFIVIRRDNSSVEQFKMEFDIESMKATMGRINMLNECLKNNTIPQCDGKFCKLGMCEYGNPNTRVNGKNTECCGDLNQMKEWGRNE